MRQAWLGVVGFMLCAPVVLAQQNTLDFNPPIDKPTYAPDTGPRVAVDSGHNNLHTADTGYRPFADLLRRDGYRVSAIAAPFTAGSLRDVDVLVIANASIPRDAPRDGTVDLSVFSEAEVDAVDAWVRAGGALMLVVDHEPWPLAAGKLAARFGVEFKNAYAYEGAQGSIVYRKAGGSLGAHAVTEGVDAVATFLGSAFRIDGEHVPLLRLSAGAVARPILSAQAQPGDEPIGGWLQGGLVEAGKGRVAVFGEAAALTAQVRGGRAMGMNAAGAEDNPRFLLNVMRWLAQTR